MIIGSRLPGCGAEKRTHHSSPPDVSRRFKLVPRLCRRVVQNVAAPKKVSGPKKICSIGKYLILWSFHMATNDKRAWHCGVLATGIRRRCHVYHERYNGYVSCHSREHVDTSMRQLREKIPTNWTSRRRTTKPLPSLRHQMQKMFYLQQQCTVIHLRAQLVHLLRSHLHSLPTL